MSGASSGSSGYLVFCRRLAVGLAAATAVIGADLAGAQPVGASSTEPRAQRFELRVGGAWSVGIGLGDRPALLTQNSVPAGADFPLFETSTELAAAPAFDARLGLVLVPEWRLVAGFSYARPDLRTTITGDAELGTSAVAVDSLDEYIVDGSVVWSPRRWRFGSGQGAPFVTGGAGYLRQLMTDRTVVENGWTVHAGVGTLWGLGRGASTQPRWGLEAELRLVWRIGAVDLEEGARVTPRAGGGVFVRF